MMILVYSFCIIMCLFMLGSYYPSPPATPTGILRVPYTDLRISEFAPDLSAALDAQPYYKLKEKERKEADREAERVRKYEESARRAIESAKRRVDHNQKMWTHYQEQLTEAKLKRWLEGNPVTRENPLKDYETPPQPTTYY